MSSKLPVWLIIRKTFDAQVNPITVYFTGADFSTKREDAKEFLARNDAQFTLNNLQPKHANEFIMQSESEYVQVV